MPPENTDNPYAAPSFHPEKTLAGPSGKYAFVKNPRRLTHLLIWLLVFFMLKNPFLYFWGYLPSWIAERSLSDAEMDAISILNIVILAVNIVVSLGTVVVFCMWIHRAGVNSRGFGAEGMSDSPRRAFGWYFVPIANLFLPYRAMKQIWQVSGNPDDWRNQPGSSILVVWWAFWTCHILHGLGRGVIADYSETLHTFRNSFAADILSFVLYTGATLAAIFLVRTITRRQQALVAASAE